MDEIVIEFKEVDGIDGYWIGSDGGLWKQMKDRKHRRLRSFLEYMEINGHLCRKLRPAFDKDGYRRAAIGKATNKHYVHVHTLVLEAFISPRPDGMVSRHLNGNKVDNRSANLAWGTQMENIADKKLHGTQLFGEVNPKGYIKRE